VRDSIEFGRRSGGAYRGSKVAGENVIRFDPESPREERLTSEEAERKLFAAATPHLRSCDYRDARDLLPTRRDPRPLHGRPLEGAEVTHDEDRDVMTDDDRSQRKR
jgi:hypothetical protein